MDRDELDTLIDDVARAVTAVEPSAALRAAVRAHLDRPSRRPLVFWPLAAATAALAIAAVLLWPRAMPSPDEAGAAAAAAAADTPADTARAPVYPRGQAGGRAGSAGAASAGVAFAGAASRAPADAPSVAPPAAAGVIPLLAPLEIAPLVITTVTPEPDVPMPLRIDGLSISPLTFEEQTE